MRNEWCEKLDICHREECDGCLKANIVRVVRCKNCKFGEVWMTDKNRVSCRFFGHREADWYCATGERRKIEK